MQVQRFEIYPVGGEQAVDVPTGAHLIGASAKFDVVYLTFLADELAETTERQGFRFFGHGDTLPATGTSDFVAALQVLNGKELFLFAVSSGETATVSG